MTLGFQSMSQNYLFVDALRPSQQFFSQARMIFCLPGLNKYYKAAGLVSCSRTQHSDSGGSSRNHNPHSGKSATIREPNHGLGIYKGHYAHYLMYVPKSSILLAELGYGTLVL